MADDELRRLLRARDASPDDAPLARRAAALASRGGDRDLAASAWQEVLRREERDPEAEARLREIGCELHYRRTDEHGIVEYENTIDRAILVRSPQLPGLFVSRRPVTWGEFRQFLLREPGEPKNARWIASHAPLRKVDTAWVLPLSNENGYALEISWLGAAAYARWAGGRLLEAPEWEEICYFVHGFEGFDEDREEWVGGRDEETGKRPTRRVLGGWRGMKEIERGAYLENDTPDIQFRYARTSWFAAERPGA